MRKLLVRIINILYIAAAGIAIYAFCTRPIFKATVNAHFTKEQVGKVVSGLFKKSSSSSESESEGEEEVRLVYRDSVKFDEYVTPEKIQEYFPNGYDLKIPLEISAKDAFDFKNTKLLDDLIERNLYTVIDKVVDSVNKPLHNLFKDIFKGFAVDTLKDEINKQIADMFPGSDLASEEEVSEVFESVYSLLDGGEPVSVDTLAETILHGKSDGEGGTTGGVLDIVNARGAKYVAYDPQPSEEDVEADRTAAAGEEKYYVVATTTYKYSHNTSEYNSETAYFKQISEEEFELWDPQPSEEQVNADKDLTEGYQYFVCKTEKTYAHNTEAYDAGATYYEKKPYTSEDINEDKITQEMVSSLEKVDGLVTKVPKLCDPQPSQAEVEADIAKEESERIYYILNESGDPVLPAEWQEGVQYYTVDKIVNDIDTAMNALIEGFLGGNSGQSRAVVRAEENLQSQESADALAETLKNYLLKMLPQNISESTGEVGAKAPYIFFALIVLFALPWAWFALVTLIRTLRRDKCWTRLGIIIFGAFIQVIFGIMLTYGTKYIWAFLAERIDALKEYANSINFDLRTGCLIPSFVWLGVVVSAIPYWIIRAPLKRRWKLERYANRKYYR